MGALLSLEMTAGQQSKGRATNDTGFPGLLGALRRMCGERHAATARFLGRKLLKNRAREGSAAGASPRASVAT